MNADAAPLSPLDPVDRACRVDSICDAFETGWREGGSPRLEDYLRDGDPSARRELLDALFAVEFSYRVRRGEAPRVEDYRDRFPADLERFTRIASDVAQDRQVAHYQVLQRLGIGSFASVYLALDTRLHRMVALKLSHGHWNDQAEAIFTREAKTAAQLDHPHIVPVFDFGRHDDTMYIAAQHVPGPSLKEWQRGRRSALAETVVLCARLAAAVHHAHQRGVIHRDLKPANIIIDPQGEPHITDFGLAKWADDATLTGTGDLKGTPAYMSPEQARGRARDVTTQSDVYALGVILYEMLTGERPFDGATDDVLRRVLTEAPRPPRQVNPGIPRDLEIVCLKALAKEPPQRYATANDLAGDLWRVSRGEPIEARPASMLARLDLWCRREPRLAAATAGVIALLFVLGCGMLYWNGSIAAARNEANKNLRGTELLAVVLAQMIDGKDPLGAHTTGLAGPQLAGFSFGQRGEAAARLGGILDELSGALEGRLLDRPQARAQLLEAVANGYRGLGRTGDARPLYLEAIALRERIAEERTRQLAVANTRFYLGWLELEEGDVAAARSTFEKVTQTRARWLGGERHPDVIAAQAGVLAAVMAGDGGDDDLLGKSWQILTTLHAISIDPLTVAAIHEVPDASWRPETVPLGRYDKLLAHARAILGEEHPVLAMLLIHAAGRHRAAGHYHRADQSIGQALPMARRYLGAHPQLITPFREFAESLAAQGEFDRALSAYRDALAIADRRQHANPRLSAEIMLRLGEAQLQSGACRRAAEEFTRALDSLRAAADPAAADSLRDTLLLRAAEAQLASGEPLAAGRHVAEVAQRLEDGGGPVSGHSRAAACLRMSSVARLLRKLGDEDAAERLDAKALQLAQEQCSQNAPLALDACAGLAAVLARHRRWAAAVKFLEGQLADERVSASPPPMVASCRRELAIALIELAKHDHAADPEQRSQLLGKAEQSLKQALEIRSRCYGAESHDVADLILDGARLQLARGEVKLARVDALRALDQHRKLHNGPHILTARAFLEVSRFSVEAGDRAQATQLARAGQSMLQELLPAAHGELREAEQASWLVEVSRPDK